MRRRSFLLLVPAAAVLAVFSTPSDARAEDADAIVKRAFGKDAVVFKGGHSVVTMTVTQEDGATEQKVFEIWSKNTGGLLRTVVRFKAPAKIAGTAFLFVERKDQPDEHWIYLPAYKKARRITAKERGTAFGGSDLTYADLERHELDEATYAKLPDDNIGKDACNVVESKPKGLDASYLKVTTWLRKTDDVPLRTVFYGNDGKPEKTLFARKIKTIEGKPVIVEARVERANSKRATELRLDDVTLETSVPDSFFSVAALESGG